MVLQCQFEWKSRQKLPLVFGLTAMIFGRREWRRMECSAIMAGRSHADEGLKIFLEDVYEWMTANAGNWFMKIRINVIKFHHVFIKISLHFYFQLPWYPNPLTFHLNLKHWLQTDSIVKNIFFLCFFSKKYAFQCVLNPVEFFPAYPSQMPTKAIFMPMAYRFRHTADRGRPHHHSTASASVDTQNAVHVLTGGGKLFAIGTPVAQQHGMASDWQSSGWCCLWQFTLRVQHRAEDGGVQANLEKRKISNNKLEWIEWYWISLA